MTLVSDKNQKLENSVEKAKSKLNKNDLQYREIIQYLVNENQKLKLVIQNGSNIDQDLAQTEDQHHSEYFKITKKTKHKKTVHFYKKTL